MWLKNLVWVILGCMGFSGTLSAQDADWSQGFEAGNQAYKDGQFVQAVAAYESVLTAGVVSKEVYANVGNAYYRLKKYGLAVLNYERALRLDPRDQGLLENLAVVKKHLKDDIEPIPDFILARWWRFFYQTCRADTWTWLGVLALWLGAAGWARWLLGDDRRWKKRGFILGTVVIPLSIVLFLAALGAKNTLEDRQKAVVLIAEVPVLAGPDSMASRLSVIHEGLKVVCLDDVQGFIRVRLPNGEEGWVVSNALMTI